LKASYVAEAILRGVENPGHRYASTPARQNYHRHHEGNGLAAALYLAMIKNNAISVKHAD
jgi:hypothetical protein